MPCRLLRRVGESFFGISYEDWLTTNDSNPSLLASEELTTAANTTPSRSNSEGISNSEDISNSRSDYEEMSNSGLLLVRMRRHVTSTPDTVFEDLRSTIEYRTFINQQRDC